MAGVAISRMGDGAFIETLGILEYTEALILEEDLFLNGLGRKSTPPQGSNSG